MHLRWVSFDKRGQYFENCLWLHNSWRRILEDILKLYKFQIECGPASDVNDVETAAQIFFKFNPANNNIDINNILWAKSRNILIDWLCSVNQHVVQLCTTYSVVGCQLVVVLWVIALALLLAASPLPSPSNQSRPRRSLACSLTHTSDNVRLTYATKPAFSAALDLRRPLWCGWVSAISSLASASLSTRILHIIYNYSYYQHIPYLYVFLDVIGPLYYE